VISAAELRQQIADREQQKLDALKIREAVRQEELRMLLEKARETVLPRVLAELEMRIMEVVRDDGAYVRRHAEEWMALNLLHDDVIRAFHGLGYKISIEYPTVVTDRSDPNPIIDIRWS
jgi:hypothetical protein